MPSGKDVKQLSTDRLIARLHRCHHCIVLADKYDIGELFDAHMICLDDCMSEVVNRGPLEEAQQTLLTHLYEPFRDTFNGYPEWLHSHYAWCIKRLHWLHHSADLLIETAQEEAVLAGYVMKDLAKGFTEVDRELEDISNFPRPYCRWCGSDC